MRWLLVRLLGLLTFLTVLAAIGAAILAYDGEAGMVTGIARSALIGGILFGFASLFDGWSRKIQRNMPPRHWTPPKAPRTPMKKAKAKPVEKVELPVEKKPRRLAPPPLIEAVTHDVQATASSLSDQMRQFIARGDQAIHAAPIKPSEAVPAHFPDRRPKPPPAPKRPDGD